MGKHITIFEHQTLKLDHDYEGVTFDNDKLNALQRFYGDKGVPYFSLVHKGIRFSEFVGVIQVGALIIEVLPKADKSSADVNSKAKWRNILIDMLRASGIFNIQAPSSSSLNLKSNSLLDLYFELFIKEVEYLLHAGLAKQYRKKEANVTALKGCLQFNKHLQQNITHQERFFVRHTTYDVEHKLHFILYKAIRLLKQINTNSALHSRIGALLLHFPEMPDINVSESTFEKLVFNRKTVTYKKAIDIAKLLLLQYHPDVSNGRNNVLALMFDMNALWEKFVFTSLLKYKVPDVTITPQSPKFFWKPEVGYRSKIIPDIVINQGKDNCVVLDTKWKNLNGFNPSAEDLRQMYVYHQYYNSEQVALIYPGENSFKSGIYIDPNTGTDSKFKCGVFSLSPQLNVKLWQKDINVTILNLITKSTTEIN